MGKVFTSQQFLDALEAGRFEEQPAAAGPLIIDGMVKRAEGEQGALLFSQGGGCQNWTLIPSRLIDHVETVRTAQCLDHEHPFVRLHLKAPDDNSDAQVFASLLASSPMAGLSIASKLTQPMSQPAAQNQPTSAAFTPLAGSLPQQRSYGAAYGRLRGGESQVAVQLQPLTTSRRPRQRAVIAPSSMKASQQSTGLAGWELVATFDFDIIDEHACFILYYVEVYRQPQGRTWDYKVGIVHGGVLGGGGCDCFPAYRTGWVEARVNGTGGGYLDTGGLDVHSSGGEVWRDFSSIYPGELQSCHASWETWCTF